MPAWRVSPHAAVTLTAVTLTGHRRGATPLPQEAGLGSPPPTGGWTWRPAPTAGTEGKDSTGQGEARPTAPRVRSQANTAGQRASGTRRGQDGTGQGGGLPHTADSSAASSRGDTRQTQAEGPSTEPQTHTPQKCQGGETAGRLRNRPRSGTEETRDGRRAMCDPGSDSRPEHRDRWTNWENAESLWFGQQC